MAPELAVNVTLPPAVKVVEPLVVICGAGTKVNPPRFAVPPAVVTLTVPFVPAPTLAIMLVAELTVNDCAAVPPKLTLVAPVKLLPVMVTWVPEPPMVGLKVVILGAATNVKPAKEPEPAWLDTTTFPEAPLPTIAVMLVGEVTLNDWAR